MILKKKSDNSSLHHRAKPLHISNHNQASTQHGIWANSIDFTAIQQYQSLTQTLVFAVNTSPHVPHLQGKLFVYCSTIILWSPSKLNTSLFSTPCMYTIYCKYKSKTWIANNLFYECSARHTNISSKLQVHRLWCQMSHDHNWVNGFSLPASLVSPSSISPCL